MLSHLKRRLACKELFLCSFTVLLKLDLQILFKQSSQL